MLAKDATDRATMKLIFRKAAAGIAAHNFFAASHFLCAERWLSDLFHLRGAASGSLVFLIAGD